MSTERGVLVVQRKKERTIVLVRIGDKPPMNIAAGEVSQSVLDRLDAFASKEVEFERVNGQPKQVREAGGSFIPPRSAARDAGRHGAPQGRGSSRPRGEQEHQRGERRERDFHNPYNFVPAPPRNTSHDNPEDDLGDHRPPAQDELRSDRYTGSIRVRMTAETPLLVPDTERENDNNGHKTFPLRVGEDGKPAIPASSVRGMLRSAYETVTNSRFGRFSGENKQKLKYRQSRPPFAKVAFVASAWDLLPDSLRPAAAIDQLSPADRVFGWVKVDTDGGTRPKGEQVAVRGLLRVGPLRCDSSAAESVESFFPPGVPLAILAAPKPQQGRFYLARSPMGKAQENGLSKVETGYSPDKGLRGRKVYPHHRNLPNGHWDNPTQDSTQQGRGQPAHYQEYRRPLKDGQERRDEQNRSILGWVKPGAQFSFDLYVQNVSGVELGALLWLLELPADHFFRLGGGKPLGFGSVRLEMEACDLRSGECLRQRYSGWHVPSAPSDPRPQVVPAFNDAVARAYPDFGSFDNAPFIKAFLTACRGCSDDLPIHYPRTTENGEPGPPSPDGESFKWFVANERSGARYALSDLAEDHGLPTLEDSSGRR